MTTRNGTVARVPDEDLDLQLGGFAGVLLRPDDAGYDEARAVWNGMIDRRPALIARCRSAEDVRLAVELARRHRLLVAVRGGGHNVAGSAVCDGGLMIDLSPMRRVTVDERSRTATVEPGATLGEVDAATQEYGLAVPTGINSTTGIAGLTLGGGFGWLSRRYGLAADNLVEAEVVTAAGEVLRASADEHSELFWALRGGGGNFGIVTRFVFALHPVGPEVLCGLIVHPLEEAPRLLRRYRDAVEAVGDETSVWAVLRAAPPLPFLPAEVHGTGIVALAVCHAGDPAEGERAIAPIRELGRPVGEHVGAMPFVQWQQAFDPLLTPGARNYWKSHNLGGLSDGLIDAAVTAAAAAPSPHCEIFLARLGGAVNRVAPDATAYAHRDVEFVVNVHGRWTSAGEDEAGIGWARDFYAAAARWATGGVYVNFMSADEVERVPSAYGGNWQRLVAVKRRWDPDNMFCSNQNIRP